MNGPRCPCWRAGLEAHGTATHFSARLQGQCAKAGFALTVSALKTASPSKQVSNIPLPHSAAAERNQQPILEALQRILGDRGKALEIASGSGQHVLRFAQEMSGWSWQPTDADASMLPVIADRISRAKLVNVQPARLLDVTAPQWPSEGIPFDTGFDAIFCANMLHIAPFATCAALMQGAAHHLAPDGVLVTYGPYFEAEVATAPGNLAFDESLRSRNPAWGIRRREDVERVALRSGLALRERHSMPANNLLLVFAVQASIRPNRGDTAEM